MGKVSSLVNLGFGEAGKWELRRHRGLSQCVPLSSVAQHGYRPGSRLPEGDGNTCVASYDDSGLGGQGPFAKIPNTLQNSDWLHARTHTHTHTRAYTHVFWSRWQKVGIFRIGLRLTRAPRTTAPSTLGS